MILVLDREFFALWKITIRYSENIFHATKQQLLTSKYIF